MPKDQNQRSKEYRDSLKQKGLKWFSAIVPEKHANRLRDEITKLREEHLRARQSIGDENE